MDKASQQHSYHVGDHVKIDFGPRKLSGIIVEDRGKIGVRGRSLFRIQVLMEPFDPLVVELSEDELKLELETPPPIEKGMIVDYLAYGGLISILRSSEIPQRVWLRHDNLGNVTHTFQAELGEIGGHLAPARAVHDGRIFSPKRSEVLAYLEGFGLEREEAETVLARVGTGP